MMMLNRLRFGGPALVMAAALLVSGSARAETLRVGVSIPAAIAFVPLQVGIETGTFRTHGLDIERADLGGAARAQQALAAAASISSVGGGPDLAIVAKGRHALAVGVITRAPRQTTLIVRHDNPMQVAGRAQGQDHRHFHRRAGFRIGSCAQLSRRLGFGADGIKYAALGADAAQVAALRIGQIDATVMDFASGLRLRRARQRAHLPESQ